MKTLHLCHWRDKNAFTNQVAWLGPTDALVVYGHPSALEIEHIQSHMEAKQRPWHLLVDPSTGSNTVKRTAMSTIDANQWLKLIIEYDNTWAWK